MNSIKLSFGRVLVMMLCLVGLIVASPVWAATKKPGAKTGTKSPDVNAKEYAGKLEMEMGKPNPNGFVRRKFFLRMDDGQRVPVSESLAEESGLKLEAFADKKVTIRAVAKETSSGKGDKKTTQLSFTKLLAIKPAF